MNIGKPMIFGNDRMKLAVFILLISIVVFAASILAHLNVIITIIIGIWLFVLIIGIVMYGFEDEE
jgi:hypothetical protein